MEKSENSNPSADTKPKSAKQIEVEANAKFFFAELKKGVLNEHEGQYALMKNKKVIDYYDTGGDARKTGYQLYKDGIFSIQKVEHEELDLGHYSHALLCVTL